MSALQAAPECGSDVQSNPVPAMSFLQTLPSPPLLSQTLAACIVGGTVAIACRLFHTEAPRLSAAALPTGLSTATPCPRAINPSINHTAALASVDQAEAATHSLVEETSDEGGLGSTHIRVKKRWFQAHQLLQYICAPKIIRNSLFDASEPKIFLASQGRTQIVN